jgi:hypothetical protein
MSLNHCPKHNTVKFDAMDNALLTISRLQM